MVKAFPPMVTIEILQRQLKCDEGEISSISKAKTRAFVEPVVEVDACSESQFGHELVEVNEPSHAVAITFVFAAPALRLNLTWVTLLEVIGSIISTCC